jgi:isoleucyl-tRNA synthetase
LRLWALSVDFTEDHRIGKEILSGVSDQYRKLRNSFRYLLGALEGFSDAEKVAVADMPELERYVLHLLADMDAKLKTAVNDFDFNTYVRLLTDFANNDLSAFFFDIRKDSLYCDAVTEPKRRAYRTVLDILFHALVRYAAPVLVFTAEEVWQTRFPDEAESVHYLNWPEVDAEWIDDQMANMWDSARYLRSNISGVVEHARRDKRIGSSLEAEPHLLVHNGAQYRAYEHIGHGNFVELCIVAGLNLIDVSADSDDPTRLFIEGETRVTENHKCGRCWRHLPEVTEDGTLCDRCAEVVNVR